MQLGKHWIKVQFSSRMDRLTYSRQTFGLWDDAMNGDEREAVSGPNELQRSNAHVADPEAVRSRVHPCTIGIVDDDPAVLRALVRLIVALGYDAEPFASAEHLLSWRRTGSLDCLLLDVDLRDMTGPELYAHLLAAGDPLPVIFVSAAQDVAARLHPQTGQPPGILSKPVDADRLDSLLARTLRGQTI